MKNFNNTYGPWALITGASDGIGREFAHQLADKGLNIILVARNEANLNELSEKLINLYQINTMVISLDLSKEDSNKTLINNIKTYDIGLFILAAGFGSTGLFFKNNLLNEVNMLQLNCQTVLTQCFLFGQFLESRGNGGIILFSSLLAFQGTPYSANYAATKAYVQSLGEGLAPEFKSKGVDLLIVAPGPINTGFGKRAKMMMKQSLSPDVVANQSLNALGNRTTIRPGWLSKLLGWSLALAPRWIAVKIIGNIVKGMSPAN